MLCYYGSCWRYGNGPFAFYHCNSNDNGCPWLLYQAWSYSASTDTQQWPVHHGVHLDRTNQRQNVLILAASYCWLQLHRYHHEANIVICSRLQCSADSYVSLCINVPWSFAVCSCRPCFFGNCFHRQANHQCRSFRAVTIETLTPHTVPLDSTHHRKSVYNSTENAQWRLAKHQHNFLRLRDPYEWLSHSLRHHSAVFFRLLTHYCTHVYEYHIFSLYATFLSWCV